MLGSIGWRRGIRCGMWWCSKVSLAIKPKVRFRGLAKNTAHVVTLFALSNLWMARKKLTAMAGAVRPQTA